MWQWLMTTTAGITVGSGAQVQYNATPVFMPLNWKLLTTSKFDGDAKADKLWRNSNDGQLWLWSMNGNAIAASARVTFNGTPVDMPTNWTLMASGDFDNNGSTELLWREVNSGQLWLWSMNGAAIATSVRATYLGAPVDMPPEWVLIASGDFQRNGTTGLVWRHSVTNQVYIWLMNGAAIVTSVALPTRTPDWSVIGVGDLDGALGVDIIWRNAATNEVRAWMMNGSAIAADTQIVASQPAQWTWLGVGDLDSDGKADLVWRDSFTGQTETWKMNRATKGAVGSIGAVP